MVYVDFRRQALEYALQNAQMGVADAKWKLKCYDFREVLHKHQLEPGKSFDFGTTDNVLAGNTGLEKCVFDGAALKIISPIIGGTNMKDTAIYQCKKCKVRYQLPLNAKDKKAHDERMREMVFRGVSAG